MTKDMPVIYYVRHGETAWNAEGRFQGSRDIPLNERGSESAGRMSDELRSHGITAIYSPPCKAAWQTAVALGEGLG